MAIGQVFHGKPSPTLGSLPAGLKLSETAVLGTTLYRNLMQASNFGGTIDQLFL